MSRAVVLGYQGFANVGDEAILTGIERLMDGLPITVDAIIGGPEPIAAFPDARRIRSHQLRPNVAGLRALARADVLLFSGGGLIHDHWRGVVPRFLAWSAAARATRTRIGWIGVGIGPLRSSAARRLAGTMLRMASLVTVRDAGSADLANVIAPATHVAVVPDPAVFNPSPAPSPARRAIGIIARAPAPRDRAATPQLANALGAEIDMLARSGQECVVMTFAGARDAPFADAVAAAARTGGASPAIEALGPAPLEVITRLASLEAIISVRLHGLILGAVSNTPAVAIAYDDKVSALADQLGMGDLCVRLQDAIAQPAGTLSRLIATATSVARRQIVASRIDSLRAEGQSLRTMIATLAP